MENIKKLVNKTSNVMGISTDVLLYHNNPFRICDISANGNWTDTSEKLRKGFTKFVTYAKIKKLSSAPIGPAEEYLLNESIIKFLAPLQRNIAKPDHRLVWKLFWFNEEDHVYSNFPKELSDFTADGMSSHSLAVHYHFKAIQNTLEFINGITPNIDFTFWNSAFAYWSKVINDAKFWQQIEQIAQKEKEAGYFDLRNFSIEKTKQEVIRAIYNSFIAFPQTIIEEELVKNKSGFYFSKFLGCILKSPLGEQKLKNEFAKNIFSIQLNSIVRKSFPDVQFITWANNGKYLNLYVAAFKFLDTIQEATQTIQEEVEDKDINTTTFLSEINNLRGIHSETVKPLIALLEGSNVFNNDKVDKKNKEKTAFTLLIIGLRILAELKVESKLLFSLKKEVDFYYKRFKFHKLTSEELSKLNSTIPPSDIKNKSILTSKYLAQYCFFIEGEFAHPDASIFDVVDTQIGNIITHNNIVIPRSQLSLGFHTRKIKKHKLARQMRINSNLKTVETEIKQLDKEIEDIQNKVADTQKLIIPINEMIEKVKDSTKRKNTLLNNTINEKIESEVKQSEQIKSIVSKQDGLSNLLKGQELKAKSRLEKYDNIKRWINKIDWGFKELRIHATLLLILIATILTYFLLNPEVSKNNRIILTILIGILGGSSAAVVLNYALGYSYIFGYTLINITPLNIKIKFNTTTILKLIKSKEKKILNIKNRIQTEMKPELLEIEKQSTIESEKLNKKLEQPKLQIAGFEKDILEIDRKKKKLLESLAITPKNRDSHHPINNYF